MWISHNLLTNDNIWGMQEVVLQSVVKLVRAVLLLETKTVREGGLLAFKCLYKLLLVTIEKQGKDRGRTA